ncbi:MAG: helix-turn-helix transcriptional regulator [Lachnospiraceae bacterium]|nr:helix-turn-helix transcriptional regulator [Lachnospiraceae bacterium]
MKTHKLADITGLLPSNLARLESGGRVPTLVVLQKYAGAVGKHIELRVCDGVE